MLSSLLVFVYLFVSSDYFLQLFVITCRWVCVFCYELHINVDAEAVSRLTHGVAAYLVYVINLSFTFSPPVCSKTKQEYRIN